jgi:hypothetical protein
MTQLRSQQLHVPQCVRPEALTFVGKTLAGFSPSPPQIGQGKVVGRQRRAQEVDDNSLDGTLASFVRTGWNMLRLESLDGTTFDLIGQQCPFWSTFAVSSTTGMGAELPGRFWPRLAGSGRAALEQAGLGSCRSHRLSHSAGIDRGCVKTRPVISERVDCSVHECRT